MSAYSYRVPTDLQEINRLQKENAELRQQKYKLEEDRKVLDAKKGGSPDPSSALALEEKKTRNEERNRELKAELERIAKYREEIPSLEKKRKKLRRKNEKLDKKSFEKYRGANSDIAAVMTFLVAPIIVIILVILIAEYM